MNQYASFHAEPGVALELDDDLFEAARTLFTAQRDNARALAMELATKTISAEDAEQLARLVHNIAGTAGYFGAHQLGEEAVQLEQGLRNAISDIDRADACKSLLAALDGAERP